MQTLKPDTRKRILSMSKMVQQTSFDDYFIEGDPMLVVVLVLTVPIALWAMRLAERTLKKPAAVLK